MKHKIHPLILTALFTALIIIVTYIKIPIPPVPITLQTAVILLAAILLGKKYGTLSVILYTLLGLFGLPVFAGGSGGFGYIITPTFGYIIGFILSAFVCGFIAERNKNSFKMLLLSAFAGMAIIYICGMAYYFIIQSLWFQSEIDIKKFIISFFLLPLPKDIITCFIVSIIGKRLLSSIKLT